jgi:hypothetical protein
MLCAISILRIDAILIASNIPLYIYKREFVIYYVQAYYKTDCIRHLTIYYNYNI